MSARFKRAIGKASILDTMHFLPGLEVPVPSVVRPRMVRGAVPPESDASYFCRRSAEERASAAEAGNDLTRALHVELAERYANLSAAIREVEERIG
jgi:hypothetical protein